MVLTDELISQGFMLKNVNIDDLDSYIDVKRTCYRKYVDEYYGGWIENIQVKMNTDVFFDMINNTCFQKVILNDTNVGFLAYDEGVDRIDKVSIQMIEVAQRRGIGSLYLQHITVLSQETKKPVFLKVFKSNPARNLYKQFGFETYSETSDHYLMRFNPS